MIVESRRGWASALRRSEALGLDQCVQQIDEEGRSKQAGKRDHECASRAIAKIE
jgi:hypothetical protein